MGNGGRFNSKWEWEDGNKPNTGWGKKEDIILTMDEEKRRKFGEAWRQQTDLPEWLKKILKMMKGK